MLLEILQPVIALLSIFGTIVWLPKFLNVVKIDTASIMNPLGRA
jgi:hypothetical protein